MFIQNFCDQVFSFLFDVPNPEQRNLPKCKSQKSRSAAYDLLVELVRGAPDNYMVLHHKLMEHHKPGEFLLSRYLDKKIDSRM